jgi:hypothetical protein
MTRSLRYHTQVRGIARAMLTTAAFFAVLLGVVVTAEPAQAGTVSGALKNGKGYQLLLVQANGTSKQVAVKTNAGIFSIRGVKLGNASLQLVKADGSYYGPVLLKATATKAYPFIKGSANLRLGTVRLMGGHALAAKPPVGRFQLLAAYTAKAVRGKPVGAGKLGRVKTAEPTGLNGRGGDLDRDGVVNAFDIDDNGNLILDDVDRTGRGANRPRAGASGAAASGAIPARSAVLDAGAPPVTADDEIFMYSSFWMNDATAINANISAISDLDGLIARYLPTTLFLQTELVGAGSVSLDGLGNSYLRAHDLDGVTYPLVNQMGPDTFNRAPATYVNGLMQIADAAQRACIWPGAQVGEIGSGDCFVQTAQDGTQYPGAVNFVFSTAPALKSYSFDAGDGQTHEVVYGANGMRPEGDMAFTVPAGASKVTLTFWRPQRKATPGEAASAGGWVDIGGLSYTMQLCAPRQNMDDPGTGTYDASGAYSNAVANGVPVVPNQWNNEVLDPALDLPSDPGHTISFTLDLAKCFSSWSSLHSGAWFQAAIVGKAGRNDEASIGLWFELE